MSEFLFCLNTSTIRPTPLLEKIAIAGKAGYNAIEPWNDEITDYLNQGGTVPELRRAVADAGLKVVSVIALHGWITAAGAEHRRVKDDCRRRMAQAAALGSPYIVASPPQEVVDLERATDRFVELIAIGSELGVMPSMEFLGFVNGIKSLASAWAIASGTGDPRHGRRRRFPHDAWGRFHRRLADNPRRSAGELPHQRLAGTTGPADPEGRGPRHGRRRYCGLAARDCEPAPINYQGPISLELFNRKLWAEDPLAVVERGLARIRALVGDEPARAWFKLTAVGATALEVARRSYQPGGASEGSGCPRWRVLVLRCFARPEAAIPDSAQGNAWELPATAIDRTDRTDGRISQIGRIASGGCLISVFPEPGRYVALPLEETYRTAFHSVPSRWAHVLESG